MPNISSMFAFSVASPVLSNRKQGHVVIRKPVACRRVALIRASRSPAEIVQDAQDVYSKEKPPWCQPWTILGTGSAVIAVSWTTLHGLAAILAVGATGAVLAWWYLFLVVYPLSVLNGPSS